MQNSSSWKASSSSASHVFKCILWNLKCHDRIHKSPPLITTLFVSSRCTSIFQGAPRSPKWYSIQVNRLSFVGNSDFSSIILSIAVCLIWSSWCDPIKMKNYEIFSVQCHPHPVTSSLPATKLFSNTLKLWSFLNVRVSVSNPYKTTAKLKFVYILFFLCC